MFREVVVEAVNGGIGFGLGWVFIENFCVVVILFIILFVNRFLV